MALNINDFLASIDRKGLARPNRFFVRVMFPQRSRNPATKDYFSAYGITQDDAFQVSLMAETTTLPGKSISTTDVTHYGVSWKHPYATVYDDVNIDFRVTGDFKEKRFFDAWQNMIIDPTTKDHNFYSEYTSTVEIYQVDTLGNHVYAVRLKEAYPVLISEMTLDHNDTDSYHKLSTTFTYKEWEPIELPEGNYITPTNDSTKMLTQMIFNQIRRGEKYIPSIATLF